MSAVCSRPVVMPDQAAGTWLAIDFGERTIGLAVAHPLTGSARPLAPILNRNQAGLEQAMRSVLKQWQPVTIVLGLPLDGQGTDTDMSRKVRRFATWLEALAGVTPIVFQDERLSSEAASSEFARRRSQGRARRRDAARMDSIAAAQILESWMTEQGVV
jgi:putative holliday junction resolvase